MKPAMPRLTPPDIVFKGPPGVGDLPARLTEEGIITEWRLDYKELSMLMQGGRVLLTIAGEQMPPVRLEVEGVNYGDN